MKIMSGRLRETLFQMPEGDQQAEMTVKEYREYAKDEVAHINGKTNKINIFKTIIIIINIVLFLHVHACLL